MERRVAALSMTDRFVFLGFRSDAPEICQLFDVVAVPSHVEPFGLASLEAMAVEVPVVASRVGGIPEVVEDGATGRLVEPRNARALADGVARLLTDPSERQAMGRRGRQRAATVFGTAAHAKGLTRIYDRLCAPVR
jgi:glycosyltransferase involved in cell wall biosynthesis